MSRTSRSSVCLSRAFRERVWDYSVPKAADSGSQTSKPPFDREPAPALGQISLPKRFEPLEQTICVDFEKVTDGGEGEQPLGSIFPREPVAHFLELVLLELRCGRHLVQVGSDRILQNRPKQAALPVHKVRSTPEQIVVL